MKMKNRFLSVRIHVVAFPFIIYNIKKREVENRDLVHISELFLIK